MRVEVVRAWPRRHELVALDLPPGATVADAIAATRWSPESILDIAVFGLRVGREHPLREGDRVEVLRPLQADPKDARRRRASRGNRPAT